MFPGVQRCFWWVGVLIGVVAHPRTRLSVGQVAESLETPVRVGVCRMLQTNSENSPSRRFGESTLAGASRFAGWHRRLRVPPSHGSLSRPLPLKSRVLLSKADVLWSAGLIFVLAPEQDVRFPRKPPVRASVNRVARSVLAKPRRGRGHPTFCASSRFPPRDDADFCPAGSPVRSSVAGVGPCSAKPGPYWASVSSTGSARHAALLLYYHLDPTPEDSFSLYLL